MSGLVSAAKRIAKEAGAHRKLDLPKTPEELDRIIQYRPRPLQAELDKLDRRFNVRVLHRRFGKTVREIRKLIQRAMWCPFDNGRYAYAAPTYSMAEDIAWMYLEQYAKRIYEHYGLNPKDWIQQSKLALYIPCHNGSRARIRLYGVDSPKQRLRGLYLDGFVADEWAEIPPSVWNEQVRPMLADDVRRGEDALGNKNQWADFIFTPKGRNHAHTMFRKAERWEKGEEVVELDKESLQERRTKRDDWSARLYKGSETGILGPDEMADMLSDMGRSKYEQEVECSFDAAVEGAIYARYIEELRENGGIRRLPYNPLLPVDTAWDLGYDDMTALWFIQDHAAGPAIIDYYEASGAGLEHYAGIMAERKYRYGRNYFPHDVEVHDLGTGKSRRDVLKSLGIRVTTVPKHSLWDGIAAVQALLPLCVFSDSSEVAEGLDRLSLYRRERNERLDILRQNPVHDWASHGADALRTYAMGRRKFRRAGAGDPNTAVSAQM